RARPAGRAVVDGVGVGCEAGVRRRCAPADPPVRRRAGGSLRGRAGAGARPRARGAAARASAGEWAGGIRRAPAVATLRIPGASAGTVLAPRFGYRGRRVTSTIDKPLAIKNAADVSEASGALAEALREVLKDHQAHDIVVLSPFGERRSLAGKLLAAEHFTKE